MKSNCQKREMNVIDPRQICFSHNTVIQRQPDALECRACERYTMVAILSLIASNRFVNGEIVVVDGGFASTT